LGIIIVGVVFFLGILIEISQGAVATATGEDYINTAIVIIISLIVGYSGGAIIGLISDALFEGRGDFYSVGGIVGDRYNVMVDEEVAEKASRLLAKLHERDQETGLG